MNINVNDLLNIKKELVVKNKGVSHVRNKTKRVINNVEDKLLGKIEITVTDKDEESLVLKNKDMYVSPAGKCVDEIYKDAKSSKITKKEEKRIREEEKRKNEKEFATLLGITIIEEDESHIYIPEKDLFKYLRSGIKELISKKENIPTQLFKIVGDPDDLQYYEDKRIVDILNRYAIPIYSNIQLRDLFFTLYKHKKLYKYLINKDNIDKLLIIIGRKKPKPPKVKVIEGMRAYIILKEGFEEYFSSMRFQPANKILAWYGSNYTDNTLAQQLPCNLEWIDKFMSNNEIKLFDKGRGCFDMKHKDIRVGLLQLFVTNGYLFD